MDDALFDKVKEVVRSVDKVVIGKGMQIRHAVACLLADGHLLIEDVPGVGKTTLAHALAAALGLGYKRVQFTSDLMPSDVIGMSVFDRESSQFIFRPGPVFTQVLLADEINRAPPRAQSALLEAMEEQQVTVEGETMSLPQPFFVIATQNPVRQSGTFALPESQLDRFLMMISLGYPDEAQEEALLQGGGRSVMPEPVVTRAEVCAAQRAVANVHASPALVRYVRALLTASRTGAFVEGLSPRAGLGLLRAAKAWAVLHGEGRVLPEHVQAVFRPVALHRLVPAAGAPATTGARAALIEAILAAVPV